MKEIKLTQGKVAIVDDEDFERLNQFKWHTLYDGYNWYAIRNKQNGSTRRSISMHREILNASSGEKVDHKNRNGLDNQKNNLRLCSHSENIRNSRKLKTNTSGFIGVSFHRDTKKWIPQIRLNNRPTHLGCFDDPIDAALARDIAAIQHYGEFANLNVATPEFWREQFRQIEKFISEPLPSFRLAFEAKPAIR